MKKVFVFILLFSFSFTILCGCGPLSPAPEGTVTPTASPTEMIHISPTIAPSPTVEPTASPESTQLPHITLKNDYSVYPENYTDIIIDESCMRFVNIPQNLREMGFGTVTYDAFGYSRTVNQYISYPVNYIDIDVAGGGKRTLGEVVSYDVIRNVIIDARPFHRYRFSRHSSSVYTIYNYMNDDGTFTTFDSEEAYNEYASENNTVNWEEYTTISKETNGILSGGIYEHEYKLGVGYAYTSPSGKYVFVSQSLEYVPSIYDEGVYVLQRADSDLQTFALVDMEAGKVIKEYTIDLNGAYLGYYSILPRFSDDDKHIILYFNFENGGNPVESIAIVIDIEASLAETPEE